MHGKADLDRHEHNSVMTVDRMHYTIGYKRGRVDGAGKGAAVGLLAAAALAFGAQRYFNQADTEKRVTVEFLEQNPQYRIKKTRPLGEDDVCKGFSSGEVLLVENKTNGLAASVLACADPKKASQFVFRGVGRF